MEGAIAEIGSGRKAKALTLDTDGKGEGEGRQEGRQEVKRVEQGS